jgi:hypothetical protein
MTLRTRSIVRHTSSGIPSDAYLCCGMVTSGCMRRERLPWTSRTLSKGRVCCLQMSAACPDSPVAQHTECIFISMHDPSPRARTSRIFRPRQCRGRGGSCRVVTQDRAGAAGAGTELRDRNFAVCDDVTLADYFSPPTLMALGFTSEVTSLVERSPQVAAWRSRMAARSEVAEFRATLPPRAPIEHARRWVDDHRSGIRRVSESGGPLGIGG